MSMMTEDLSRDRMRSVQYDAERSRAAQRLRRSRRMSRAAAKRS